MQYQHHTQSQQLPNKRNNNTLINKKNIYNYNKNNKKYDLAQDVFDPLQQSPPNDFMIHLYIRMNQYNIKNVDGNNNININNIINQ